MREYPDENEGYEEDGSENSGFTRMRKAVEQSFEHLKPFRETRETLIKEYVGGHYGKANHARPNNMIYNFIRIMKRHLIPQNPRAKVDTFIRDQKPTAASFEQALNYQVSDMHVKSPLQLCVIDALCSLGVARVALNYSDTVEFGGIHHDVSEPFLENIEFEDFVWDTNAKTTDQCKFMGHRYPMTIEDMEESGLFEDVDIGKVRENKATRGDNYSGESKTNFLTTQNTGDLSNFKDTVILWEIWLARENKVITYVDGTDLIVREVEWFGVETGPYHLLGFDAVPGNVMPVAPASQLYDLHMIVNTLTVKSANQAKRQKTITAVGAGSDEDARRIVNAKDGHAVKVQDASNIQELSMGGVAAGNMQMVGIFSELFSKNGGNLDTLAGLDTGAETLGQEQMLAAKSSEQVRDMADEVTRFVGGILKAIGFYLWDDPMTNIPIKKKIAGIPDLEVSSIFNDLSKEGSFEDYALDVNPYSLQPRTPADETNTIIQLVSQVYLPLAEQAMQQGVQLDVAKLWSNIGDDLNLPSLSEVIIAQEPLTEETMPNRERPKQAAHTVREHVRHNATPRQKNEKFTELANALSGDNDA